MQGSGSKIARKRKVVVTECRLCKERRKLCRSHIIPEWAYRPLYDEDHRAIEIGSEDRQRRTVQVGLREYLFCRCCEQFFQKIEDPFFLFWSAAGRFPVVLDQLFVRVSGIDYENTRKFLLSILWRAHVATKPVFTAVNLGPHADRIRNILVADAGAGIDDDYPIFCRALRDPDTGGLAKELVLTPARMRLEGRWNYEVAFLGCLWNIFVSRSEPPLPRSCMLKRDGTIVIPVVNYNQPGIIRRMFA
jgi:hypothetical protein